MNPAIIVILFCAIFSAAIWLLVVLQAARIRNKRENEEAYSRSPEGREALMISLWEDKAEVSYWETEMNKVAISREEGLKSPLLISIVCDFGPLNNTEEAVQTSNFWGINKQVQYFIKAENLDEATRIFNIYANDNPFAIGANLFDSVLLKRGAGA